MQFIEAWSLNASMLSTRIHVCCILQHTLEEGSNLLQKQGSHQLRPYSRAQPARRTGQDSRVMPSGPTLPAELCPTTDRFGWHSTSLSYKA